MRFYCVWYISDYNFTKIALLWNWYHKIFEHSQSFSEKIIYRAVKSSNALSVCSFSLHFHLYYISNVIAHINSPKISVKAWIFPQILLNILTKVSQSFSWIEAGKHLKRSDKKRVRKQPQLGYADEGDIEYICFALWALAKHSSVNALSELENSMNFHWIFS